jgi:hypothetical protein
LNEGLDSSADHQFFDFANRLCWVESFGAYVNAIHDGVASEESVGIFQIVESTGSVLISAVGDEAISL